MPPIRQYINLDPDRPDELNGLDKKRAGTKVALEATVNPAKKGVAVTFEIRYGQNNAKSPGRVKKKKVSTDKSGKATASFTAAAIGGEEYTVAAYVKGTDEPVVSDTYVTWRRIYYQMSRVDTVNRGAGRNGGTIPAVPALDFTNIVAEYESHFIELVDDTPHGAALVAHPTVVVDTSQGLDPITNLARQGYDPKREPVAMKFVVVNHIATSAIGEVTTTVYNDDGEGMLSIPKQPWSDEGQALNDDWVVDAHCRTSSADPWTPLSKSDLRLNSKGSTYVFANLSELEGAPDSVEVRLRYRSLSSETNGFSLRNAVFVADNAMYDAAPTVAQKEQTAVHEIGHFIGMVPQKQSSYYEKHGHSGPHCWTGLTPQQRAQADYHAAKLPGTCIMFGENSDARQASFCDACKPSVRASSVRNATSIR